MNVKTLFLAAAVVGAAGLSSAAESNSSPNNANWDAWVVAQNQPAVPKAQSSKSNRTMSPETTGQDQPQGSTGPINTTIGGAPAESPQGETPPGMQSAPEGSSKTMVAPKQ